MEIRKYKTDIDLRRAWKQFKNKGRSVRFHDHNLLTLVMGPLLPPSNDLKHKAYKSARSATNAINRYNGYENRMAVLCQDHENCVVVLDINKIDKTLDRLEAAVCKIGDKVKITRGIFKNARGTIKTKTSKGTIWVLLDLQSKSFSIEIPISAIIAV